MNEVIIDKKNTKLRNKRSDVVHYISIMQIMVTLISNLFTNKIEERLKPTSYERCTKISLRTLSAKYTRYDKIKIIEQRLAKKYA